MSISASAVLVELNISVWPASKIDRVTTEQVNSSAGAVRDASQSKKNLFAGTPLRKNIEKFAAKVRLYHNLNTLPWADKGERILPTKLFMEYKQHMNAYEQTFLMMCDDFFDHYDRLVNEAQVNMGKLYDPADYPELEEVKNKFGFNRTTKPLSDAGDFRLDIPAHDLEEMKEEYEKQYSGKLAEAMRAPWERLHTMLTAMSKKLTEDESDDGEEKTRRFHDSLVSNPLELCELLTKLNVTNDPKLEEARKELELTMLGASIDRIKDDPTVRSTLKGKVDAILTKFEW